MLTHEQIKELLYKFSDFYSDHLPVDNQLMKLVNIYASTVNYAWNVYQETENANHVRNAETLRYIPYFRINIQDALYDLDTARVLAGKSFEEQLVHLDKEGLYATLSFSNHDASGEPVVYGGRFFVEFDSEEPMLLYRDYFLRQNRFYILPNYVQSRRKFTQYLHAFDLRYDDYTLEKNFGAPHYLAVGPLLPRYEYRDVLEAFNRLSIGNQTVKHIEDSIYMATKWNDFALIDYKSPTISRRKKALYDKWILSPLKFIITLPEELISDKVKVNIVRALLQESKEAQTDFMVFFDINRKEKEYIPDEHILTAEVNYFESFTPEDTSSDIETIKLNFKEDPLDIAGYYDSTYFYNNNLRYDYPLVTPLISLESESDSSTVYSGVGLGEDVTITYRKLKIPRNFIAETDGTTGAITFSVDTNDDADTSFELYGATEENGDYTLIETITNDASKTNVSFIHDANQSGMMYYKTRTIKPGDQSLYTLSLAK